ncbi:hypothetical protein A2415_02390 [candidate division WWE3 bacterium RIFOXYC1_FULL_39_7]|uniref:Uncharacterized protein n=2 Tax=Katanobacteria TaxID=422282 RepID=A0A1F4X5X6_UNCKA|nr:MAG: hypothetical protein A2415_02390 [candidate division WWE3 bacterium RIFOXYC1_FULL_39_7]OGC77066.1 MAG: hypothetical protein A2619_01570 [candidate division WWE3 bacterium RIFOXYD1_FULL_39_9]
MKKNLVLVGLLLVAFLLTACAEAPVEIYENEMSAEVKTGMISGRSTTWLDLIFDEPGELAEAATKEEYRGGRAFGTGSLYELAALSFEHTFYGRVCCREVDGIYSYMPDESAVVNELYYFEEDGTVLVIHLEGLEFDSDLIGPKILDVTRYEKATR